MTQACEEKIVRKLSNIFCSILCADYGKNNEKIMLDTDFSKNEF